MSVSVSTREAKLRQVCQAVSHLSSLQRNESEKEDRACLPLSLTHLPFSLSHTHLSAYTTKDTHIQSESTYVGQGLPGLSQNSHS